MSQTVSDRAVSLARRAFFSCGRVLSRPDWDKKRNQSTFGKRVHPHGHDYVLDVFYRGTPNAQNGMIVNLTEIKPILARALEPLDGHFLNDIKYFQSRLPTLENLVNFIWNQLPPQIETGQLLRVRLQETAQRYVEKDANSMRLTTKYEFAAAHRLNAPTLSPQQNAQLYGKCNNLRGHGHNYGLEVTVEGQPDAQTGAIISLLELDKIVEEEIFARFDHKHLNEDCAEFKDLIPTSENLARVIFSILQPRIDGNGRRLAKIGLHETQKNYFEVEA